MSNANVKIVERADGQLAIIDHERFKEALETLHVQERLQLATQIIEYVDGAIWPMVYEDGTGEQLLLPGGPFRTWRGGYGALGSAIDAAIKRVEKRAERAKASDKTD